MNLTHANELRCPLRARKYYWSLELRSNRPSSPRSWAKCLSVTTLREEVGLVISQLVLTPGNWLLTRSAGFSKPDGAIVPLLTVKLYRLVTPAEKALILARFCFGRGVYFPSGYEAKYLYQGHRCMGSSTRLFYCPMERCQEPIDTGVSNLAPTIDRVDHIESITEGLTFGSAR